MSKFFIVVYGFFLALFMLLSYLAHQAFIFPGDIAISLRIQAIDPSLFRLAMQALSYLGSLIPAMVIVALVSVGLTVSGRKLEAIFAISLPSLAALLDWLLKWLIDRPRPSSGLIGTLGEGNGLSFPSGHLIYAVVFYGFLFYLVPRLTRQPAVIGTLRVVLILLILLTGVSRIYLGAHWPTDTIGSLLLGGLLLVPAILWHNSYLKDRIAEVVDKNA